MCNFLIIVANAICDLVSSGSTLMTNNLKEVYTILDSEGVLVKTPRSISKDKNDIIDRLLIRLDGVMKAFQTKYIMMNAKRSSLPKIKEIIPGMERPSIMELADNNDGIAVHAVCREDIFWETIEKLKAVGASSILILPIEKIID